MSDISTGFAETPISIAATTAIGIRIMRGRGVRHDLPEQGGEGEQPGEQQQRTGTANRRHQQVAISVAAPDLYMAVDSGSIEATSTTVFQSMAR